MPTALLLTMACIALPLGMKCDQSIESASIQVAPVMTNI